MRNLSPRMRRAVIYAGTVILLLIVIQFVFPGAPGGGRGTPGAYLFQGLVTGMVLSLFATGLVLIYRTIRVVNFAQGSIGSVGAFIAVYFVGLTPVPFPIAFLLGLAVCAALGAIVGIFLLRFFSSSRLFISVVTIVGASVFGRLIPLAQRLPFYPSPDELTTREQESLSQIRSIFPFPGFEFQIGDLPIKFGFAHVFALEASIFALLGVVVFLRYTKAGTAVRALAENSERASLLGIGVGSLSIVVWIVAGALDFFGAFLAYSAAPEFAGNVSGAELSLAVLIPPMTAAVIARFRDLPTAIFASVVIGIFMTAFNFSFPSDTGLFYVILLVVIAGALLTQRTKGGRSEAAEVSWAATTEPRPIPSELSGISSLQIARWAFIVVGVLLVVLFPIVASTTRIALASVICIEAMAVLSLVVLTGWAGQVSLGQYAFVAIGSVVGGALTSKVGIPFWFALPITAAITGAIAALLGVPALRIRGLFLLVSTFVFAVAVQLTIFNDRYFGWLLPESVERPSLFFIDFESERNMYYLCVAALVLSIVLVVNLRRSRVGRVLIAMRENEANVQSFGVSALRMKMVAFAVAGAIAGFAGAIFAHQQQGVAAASFSSGKSIEVFIQAVVGGVSSPAGALLGAAYFNLSQEFGGANVVIQAFLNSAGPLLLLFLAPGGFISLLNQVRDSVLRIVAQRRRIIVPSLFADYDPDLLERQLIPLGEPDLNSGLAALPIDERFVLRSELYSGRGERIADKLAPPKEDKDAAALSAANRSFSDLELASAEQP